MYRSGNLPPPPPPPPPQPMGSPLVSDLTMSDQWDENDVVAKGEVEGQQEGDATNTSRQQTGRTSSTTTPMKIHPTLYSAAVDMDSFQAQQQPRQNHGNSMEDDNQGSNDSLAYSVSVDTFGDSKGELHDLLDTPGNLVGHIHEQINEDSRENDDISETKPQEPDDIGEKGHAHRRSSSSLTRTSSKSTFRSRNDGITSSMRVVKFDLREESSEDNDDDDQGIDVNHIHRVRINKQQQRMKDEEMQATASLRGQNEMERPVTSDTQTQTKQIFRDGSSSNSVRNESSIQALTSELSQQAGKFFTQLAYSFRSPAPVYHKEPTLPQSTVSYENIDRVIDGSRAKISEAASLSRTNSSNSSSHHHHPHEGDIVAGATNALAAASGTNNYDESSPLLAMAVGPTTSASTFSVTKDVASDQQTRKGSQRSSTRRRSQRKARQQSITENVINNRKYIAIAVAFLQDYQASRPPTFPSTLEDITPFQLELYRIKYTGFIYPWMRFLATFALFLSSLFEGFTVSFGGSQSKYHLFVLIATILNLFSFVFFMVDIALNQRLRGIRRSASNGRQGEQPTVIPTIRSSSGRILEHNHHVRVSRAERLVKPLVWLLEGLALENLVKCGWMIYSHQPDLGLSTEPVRPFILFLSFFKPLVLFYVSTRARDAMEALWRILRIVARVLCIELLLIVMFAAVACRLFHDYEAFKNLSTAWLSLFELSTTVVNPGIWMDMYNDSRFSALFFIFFVVTSTFYFHSLVLSVVFQTYIQAAGEIHQRSTTDREDAVQLAFLALTRVNNSQRDDDDDDDDENGERKFEVVSLRAVRQTLREMRPHYNSKKINALMDIMIIVNTSFPTPKTLDYTTFRTRIRHALNASIRSARHATTLSITIELMAVFVAVVNFIYVILVSSTFDDSWFDRIQVNIGFAITLVAAFELIVRFNPGNRIPDFTPLTRFNTTFDGLATVAAVISSYGIALFVLGYQNALEYIVMGRTIDVIRIMRFFQIFRDIVRRSSDVFPVLLGPVLLVFATVHAFAYFGMGLWGGAVVVGSHAGELTHLYDLNNFNSYREGMVTMFQVLVVNDWYAIAKVFLFAHRCSSPYIVYPFFVAAILIGVSIMLNVLTAFFVETFVTKLTDERAIPTHSTSTLVHHHHHHHHHSSFDLSIQTSESTAKRHTLKRESFLDDGSVTDNNYILQEPMNDPARVENGSVALSETTSQSETFEFDLYEREGFDKIMQTVAGSQQSEESARRICDYLEIFESLSPSREKIGYLVCDQLTLERFGNQRFQTTATGFLDEHDLHVVINDMQSELLALAARSAFSDRTLLRTFPHGNNDGWFLEISAAVLRSNPALTLFISRQIRETHLK